MNWNPLQCDIPFEYPGYAYALAGRLFQIVIFLLLLDDHQHLQCATGLVTSTITSLRVLLQASWHLQHVQGIP